MQRDLKESIHGCRLQVFLPLHNCSVFNSARIPAIISSCIYLTALVATPVSKIKMHNGLPELEDEYNPEKLMLTLGLTKHLVREQILVLLFLKMCRKYKHVNTIPIQIRKEICYR